MFVWRLLFTCLSSLSVRFSMGSTFRDFSWPFDDRLSHRMLGDCDFSVASRLIFYPSSRKDVNISAFLSLAVESVATSTTLFPSGEALFVSIVVNVSASCFSTDSFTTFTR